MIKVFIAPVLFCLFCLLRAIDPSIDSTDRTIYSWFSGVLAVGIVIGLLIRLTNARGIFAPARIERAPEPPAGVATAREHFTSFALHLYDAYISPVRGSDQSPQAVLFGMLIAPDANQLVNELWNAVGAKLPPDQRVETRKLEVTQKNGFAIVILPNPIRPKELYQVVIYDNLGIGFFVVERTKATPRLLEFTGNGTTTVIGPLRDASAEAIESLVTSHVQQKPRAGLASA